METISNDGPDLDDCRALNQSPTSSIRPACSNNRRQISRSPASTPACARSLRNLAILLLAGFVFLAASFVLPAQAYVVPTSPDQPATAAISHDDRFIASAHLERASVARSSDADADFSLIPGSSTSPTAEWIKLQIASDHPDGIVSQAFLDELYERLTLERRSDAASQVVAEPLLQRGATKLPSSRRRLWKRATSSGGETCGETKLSTGQKAAYGILIPILVVLSGLFAGLTLGYMSLDETQLQVLALQGTPKQKRYAEKIMPIRKDGHLLLTTLLIANMITNETLPIIADPLLGGGVQAVIVSIVLVVIFAELIPQSVCSRYGLAIGAKLAPLTRGVMLLLWPIAFPVSRVLHWTLGPHHGIVYRRSELKELVNMHAATAGRGDLNNDTVTIVGGALDLQEKVVKQAMTPIDQVFMISIDSKLGYDTLQQIVSSGHSRIPVYQEIEIPLNRARGGSGTLTPSRGGGFFSALSRKASTSQTKTSIDDQRTLEGSVSTEKEPSAQDVAVPNTPAGDKATAAATTMIKRKKIIGALLVKQCVLLDPEDETPVRDMVINALPTVPADEPLLNLLNVFQEGRSHLAIVSSRTRRSSPGSFVDLGSQNDPRKTQNLARSGTAARIETLGNIDEEKQLDDGAIKKSSFWSRHLRRHHRHPTKSASLDLPPEAMRDDVDASAVATEMAQRDVPIGIITLEDVLEELIGEEILDEYDSEVEQNFAQISPPASPGHKDMVNKQVEAPSDAEEMQLPGAMLKLPTSPKIPLPRFKLGRSVTQKDAAVGATPGAEFAALPATPVTESRAVLPATQEADTSEPAQFPFDAVVERGASSRPSSRPGSRPVSPGPAAVLGNSTDAQLVAPRANKPVVIRHQAPDGTIATAIVGEGLLRGRTTTLASERTVSGEVSRSTTPSGTRVSRFKSTPLPGTPATGVVPRSKTPGKPEVGSSLAEEVGSAAAPVASPEELDTDPAKKQLGGDSDDTDTL